LFAIAVSNLLASFWGDLMKKIGVLHRFLLIFSLVSVRFLAFGFKYYPQLDDYIQYINYSGSNNFLKVIFDQGLLSARPLAGILDVYLWSRFAEMLVVPVIIISALWALSGIFFSESFKYHFKIGEAFLVIYALVPYGFEGVYWLSASTRIVVGLFFSSFAGYILTLYFNSGRKRLLPLFVFLSLCAVSLYEQVLVFFVAHILMLGILNIKSAGKRTFWVLTAPIIVAMYFAFTKAFGSSATYSQRMILADFTGEYYFGEFLPMLFSQFYNVFIKGNLAIFVRGAIRGVRLVFTESLWLYALIIVGLSFVMWFFCKKSSCQKKSFIIQLLTGCVLVVAPLAPFFVIDQPWFSFRGAVTSFCGTALAADALLHILNEKIYRIAVVTFCAVCCIASVSELYDYKLTTENDIAVVKSISEVIDEETDGAKRIAILNLSPSYLKEENYSYHEHIHGVTESEWALTAAFVASTEMWPEPQLVPLLFDDFLYKEWNYGTNNLSVFDAVYYYDGEKLIPADCQKTDYGYLVSDRGGNVMFEIEEKNKKATIRYNAFES